MTYCLAIKTREGLVLASDSRTSASVDDVRTYAKMHTYEFPGERVFVLLSAGNLATTHAVKAAIQRDLDDPNAIASLRTARHMFDAAEYIGRLNSRAQRAIAEERKEEITGLEATFILGGQIRGEEPTLYLIYTLGNCISTSPETPFLQIGESKYGKPILDRIVRRDLGLEDAARCALVSLDSTMRSNISVAPPLDLVIYHKDELAIGTRMRLDYDTPYYRALRESWGRELEAIFHRLPRFEWEAAASATQLAAPAPVAVEPGTGTARTLAPTSAEQAAQIQQQ